MKIIILSLISSVISFTALAEIISRDSLIERDSSGKVKITHLFTDYISNYKVVHSEGLNDQLKSDVRKLFEAERFYNFEPRTSSNSDAPFTSDYNKKLYATGGLPALVYSFDEDSKTKTKLYEVKPANDKSEGDDFGRSLTIMDELLIISAPYDGGGANNNFTGSIYGFEEQEQGYEEVWEFNIKHNMSPDISDIGLDLMTNLDSYIKFHERVDFAMYLGEYICSDGRYLAAIGSGRLYLYEILKGQQPRKIKQIVYATLQPGIHDVLNTGQAPLMNIPGSFSIKDQLLVVGYWRAYSQNTPGAGEVVFFDLSSGIPVQSQVLTFPGSVEEEDNFGGNVLIRGNILRVTSSGVDRFNSSRAESFYRLGSEIDDTQNTSSSNSLESVFSFVDKENDWGESSWFGYCWNKSDTNWIFHSLLKWLYVHVNADGSVWLYSKDLNATPSWLWTSPNEFPYIFLMPAGGTELSQGYWIHLNINSGLIRNWVSNVWSIFIDLIGNDDSDTSSTNSSNNNASSTFDTNNPPSTGMIWVEPGTFTMGQDGVATPVHEVTLTSGFYLGKYEVTQAQYEAVMTGNVDGLSPTPSSFGGNPNRPVENVSWDDVQIFLNRLNALQSENIPASWSYVLPTEAQWEYACRAGMSSEYSWGDNVVNSWGDTNTTKISKIGQTIAVGQYAANPWGFFDMHGNVGEWCADYWHDAYPGGSLTNPTGPASGSFRVLRGGKWPYASTPLGSASRSFNSPSLRSNSLGFRVSFQNE